MKSNIECPNCNEIIGSEKFDFRLDGDVTWYKLIKTNMHCPHCGIRLMYEFQTQFYAYFIGVALLLLTILTVLEFMPSYSLAFAPVILYMVFFKIRKLSIYKHNE